jgi:hypothetical protein
MTKTDSVSVDRYKDAYKKYVERETHTLDFDDARVELIADRVGFLMDKSIEMLKNLLVFILDQQNLSKETPTVEVATQDKSDCLEEKRSLSPR